MARTAEKKRAHVFARDAKALKAHGIHTTQFNVDDCVYYVCTPRHDFVVCEHCGDQCSVEWAAVRYGKIDGLALVRGASHYRRGAPDEQRTYYWIRQCRKSGTYVRKERNYVEEAFAFMSEAAAQQAAEKLNRKFKKGNKHYRAWRKRRNNLDLVG